MAVAHGSVTTLASELENIAFEVQAATSRLELRVETRQDVTSPRDNCVIDPVVSGRRQGVVTLSPNFYFY